MQEWLGGAVLAWISPDAAVTWLVQGNSLSTGKWVLAAGGHLSSTPAHGDA